MSVAQVLRSQVLLFVAVVSAIRAQGTPNAAAKLTIELETRQRWMNARQMPIHTPTVSTTHLISVDSVVTDSAAAVRVFWGRIGERRLITDPIRFTTRLDGHLTAVEVTPRQSPGLAMARTARDSARMSRFGLIDFSGVYLTLPAARVWDAVLVYRGRRLQPGERWTDTLAYSSSVREMYQSMTGRRVYTIVRDTTVQGRRLWIVRDSASVEIIERYSVDERRLDSLAAIERRASGFVIGRSLYDPSIGLFRARTDSTALRGEAALRYPDGRVFRSPTRLERTRKWTVYEPDELARREAQLVAQRDSSSFSIVSVPRNSLEERLSAGDKGTLDSLYDAWFRSRDADQRAGIKTLLSRWGTHDSVSRARLRAARAAEGDTIYLIERSRYDNGARLTMRDAQLLLPFMRDPGLAFQYGVSRDIPYERVVETLLPMPPAIEPDTSKWLCEPAACRVMGEQWHSATEPRLKSVGLSVLALVNPRQWRDTFLIQARNGDNVSQLALQMIAGYSGRGNNSPPVPDARAGWTAWRDWVRGPPTSPPPPPPSGRGALPPRPPAWLTTSGNTNGLRMVQVATGRDIAGELRVLFREALDDTARVVIGNILSGLRALPFTVDSIAKYVVSPSPLIRAFASRLVTGGFGNSPSLLTLQPADSSVNDAIQDQLITALVAKREPWRTIEQRALASGGAGPFQNPPSDAPGAKHPVYYQSDSLSSAVRAKWGGQLPMMSGREWQSRSSREGSELWSLSRVLQNGPFATVSVQVAGRIERAANQGPQAWYSWTTYYLIRIDGDWVLVTKTSAVT